MQKIGFYIIYSFIWTLTLLPFCCYYLVSDFLYFIIYIVVGYRKQIVRTNLKNSFPDKTLKELQILEKNELRIWLGYEELDEVKSDIVNDDDEEEEKNNDIDNE
jgi:KDO2-lipid IV(A) lauroyltransferase